MNKLVSRNPVLRFKEGKKILKFELAGKIWREGNRWFREDPDDWFGKPIKFTNLYSYQGKNYGSFDGGKTYYSVDSGKPLNSRSNLILLNAINRRNTPKPVVKTGDEGNGTGTKTGKVSTKTPINWDTEFTNNFTNTLTNAQRLYLDSKGVNYGNAADVLKFLMSLLQTNLGGYKDDGKWGKNSILAWKDFAANNIPENFDLLRNQETMTIGNKPYVEQPTTPAPTLGYRTGNTYEENDFSNRMKSMGIKSNADLIDFMHRTNGENFNWNGDDWARQFRSDVNQALGGNYSDANIRKVFNTQGNWGKGFLGRGDIGDFQNALQTNAGIWNGRYNAKVGNLVKNIDWSKFKLFKLGGNLLPSRNVIKRFKLEKGGLINFYKRGSSASLNKGETKYKSDFQKGKVAPVGEDFTLKVVSNVKSITLPMQEHTLKASKRNKNTAALLLLLWNSGAFKGVIDKRTGKQVTYERAVDGHDGKMTRQALNNYLKMRESIQINTPKLKTQQSSINPFPEMNVNVGYGDSNLGNGYSTSKYRFAGDSNPITYTLVDLFGAPLNRLGKKVGILQTVPTLTMGENSFSEADTEFLREAIRRAELDVPEFKGTTRKEYFEKNPDAVVKYHFTGKTSKEHPTSGYLKFFGIPYGGVMASGVSNALSKPNYRIQNTLGGFDIIYTKDNAKVLDDWGYHSGAGNWESIGGIIKKVGEAFGTKRNGEEPIIIKTDASFPYLENEKLAKRTFTE